MTINKLGTPVIQLLGGCCRIYIGPSVGIRNPITSSLPQRRVRSQKFLNLAVLFTIANVYKQPRCSPAGEWKQLVLCALFDDSQW